MTVLTPDEARRIAVTAQGLNRFDPAGDSASVLRRLGCIQIDSMSAVRRSHELVLLGRGAPAELDGGRCFEGMAHALSLIAMELWPAFGFRRRHVLANGWRGPAVDMDAVAVARGRLEKEGRVRLRDFGGTSGQGWERDSPYRWALEWLAATGGAVCGERDRWERVYSRPELVIPDAIRAVRLDDEECVRELCRRAVAALGVATTGDVADYFRIRPSMAAGALESLGFARTQVSGWREIAWLSPDADPGRKVDEERVTALSPFDSLVWTRERQLRLFGRDYRLEAYKPAAKRTFGYFAMPVLAGSEIVGRVALRRRSGTLVVENAEGMAWSMLGLAVGAVAEWTGCSAVKYEIPGDDTVPSERGQPRSP